MANTYVKIYMHIIFHVKNSAMPMRHDDLPRIFEYIGGVVNGTGGKSLAVGGVSDHVHLLVSMPKNLAVPNFVNIVKTATTTWLKDNIAGYDKFAWQDGYGAFSVSPSIIQKTTDYILGQEEHHKRFSYENECRSIYKMYDINFDERYAFCD